MAQWKNLPTEVTVAILRQAARQSTKHRDWTNVNKLFYTQGKPAWFQELIFYFDIHPIHVKLAAIYHSPFYPGQWVQKIVLTANSVPEDWKTRSRGSYNLEQDPLYNLMQLCPNVKEVHSHWELYFKEDLVRACQYFYFILERVKSPWELQHVPSYIGVDRAFEVIYALRNTLVELMLNSTFLFDNSALLNFRQLSRLVLKDADIKKLSHVQKYLKYLPQLEYLEVCESNDDSIGYMEDDTTVRLDDTNCILTQYFTHPRLHTLDVRRFCIMSDQELLFIMQAFPALNKIDISQLPMPENEDYSQDTLQSFFEYLFGLENFSIKHEGKTQKIVETIEFAYSNFLVADAVHTDIDTRTFNRLVIRCMDKNLFFEGVPQYFTLTKTGGTDLTLYWFALADEWQKRVRNLFAYFDSVEIDMKAFDFTKCVCPFFFFGTAEESIVEHVKLKSGLFNIFNVPFKMREQSVKSLEFNNVDIYYSKRVLPSISKMNIGINQLTFSTVRFHLGGESDTVDDVVNEISIIMEDTDAGTVTLYNCLDIGNYPILLSIYLVEKDCRKYYRCNVESNLFTETDQVDDEEEDARYLELKFNSLDHFILSDSTNSIKLSLV